MSLCEREPGLAHSEGGGLREAQETLTNNTKFTRGESVRSQYLVFKYSNRENSLSKWKMCQE